MRLEDEARIFVHWENEFPIDEVRVFADVLDKAEILVPGFIPPDVGLLNPEALVFQQEQDGWEFIIQPDRNIVSEIASVAKKGLGENASSTRIFSAVLMAFSQSMNINFDPSISYHELAHTAGLQIAQDEYRYFLIADQPQAAAWVNLCYQRIVRLPAIISQTPSKQPFDMRITRWQINYIVALKIACIELSDLHPFQKAMGLLDWMIEEFIWAGASALFAAACLSPNNRGQKIKRLRSASRDNAVASIKNTAWDMTYLGYFGASVSKGSFNKTRYIFASNDRALREVAYLMQTHRDGVSFVEDTAEKLQKWWKPKDAKALAEKIERCNQDVVERGSLRQHLAEAETLQKLIEDGEQRLFSIRDLNYKPD